MTDQTTAAHLNPGQWFEIAGELHQVRSLQHNTTKTFIKTSGEQLLVLPPAEPVRLVPTRAVAAPR